MSEPVFQSPGDDEPITDDEIEDDPLEKLEIFQDDAPNATDKERAVCPHCDRSWTGPTRNANLAMHIRFNHKEEEHGHSHDDAPKNEKSKPGPKPKVDKAPRGTGSKALKEVHDNVEFFYNMAGSILSMKDDVCGNAIKATADKAATAWVELAKSNAMALRFWSGGAAATGWLQLAMAHLPIAMTIQMHHVAPRMQARQEAFEAGMMESNGESIEDLAGEPVVYTTVVAEDLPENAFVPSGAGPGFTTSDLPYDVGENGFTEGAFQ